MWTARRFRIQAALCASLAKQTHDEESRQRFLRLEQTYIHIAEAEDKRVGQLIAFAGSETKPAA